MKDEKVVCLGCKELVMGKICFCKRERRVWRSKEELKNSLVCKGGKV